MKLLLKKLEQSILKIANGDYECFKFLYDELNEAVYTLSYIILKDRYLAEDVSQEVFCKVMANAASYKKGTSPKAWVLQIVRNASIDVLRKKKEIVTSFDSESGYENIISDIKQKTDFENKLIVFEALKQLDFEQQQIVVMHVIAGLKFKEISNILERPMGTVTWKYRTAIKNMYDLLK